jgi:hypothetical protein
MEVFAESMRQSREDAGWLPAAATGCAISWSGSGQAGWPLTAFQAHSKVGAFIFSAGLALGTKTLN